MILKNISIINYKNIKGANLELSPKINCLIGHNGMGKTNFLDAIYYLSFCRSASNPIDSQIITHDEAFFMLEGNYENDNGDSENIYCGMKRGTKKHFKHLRIAFGCFAHRGGKRGAEKVDGCGYLAV